MAICAKCKETSPFLRVLRCVQCFKHMCDRCAVRRYSQKFCSDDCAKAFFFGTGEEFEDEP